MNDVERLRERLAHKFPDHPFRLTQPYLATGFWHLDMPRGELDPVVIEWKAGLGFGVSTPEAGDLGVGVDEIYPDCDSAYDRVVALVLSGGVTAGHPDALKSSLAL